MSIVILLLFSAEIVAGRNDSEKCPFWMTYNDSSKQCNCNYHPSFTCHGELIKLAFGHCLFSMDNRTLSATRCPYSHYQLAYLRNLNSSVTPDEFNEMMCGPLKRQGLFCSKCKPGYGIPVFSKVVDECVKCDSRFAWPLYLALVLIPITLFYIVVIIFNFSATRPPITAYIFYCQLFSQIVFSPYNIHFTRHSFEASYHVFLYLTLSVCDIWNLNMLRYLIPEFCLSEELGNIDALFLELLTAFYPVVLIILTSVFIEMHANNFRVVVFLWKPFHKCFSFFRRTWDPESSVINAFATFLLLSSFKVCFLAFTFFNSVHFDDAHDHDRVLYIEPTVKFYKIYKQPYFIPFILLIVSFVIVPMFLLCLYPTKCCKIACRRICSARQRIAIFLFMDAFQGHYKDGTDGTYDYRSASCIGFVIRFVVCMIFSINTATSGNDFISCVNLILLLLSLFYANLRPYKKQYLNVIESSLHITAAVALIVVLSIIQKKIYFYDAKCSILLVIIFAPSVVIVCAIVYKLLGILRILDKIKRIVVENRLTGKAHESPEVEPHRLTHPTQYTPLLH